jgi:hypothetical protein
MLCDYATAESIRPATVAEARESAAAAEHDGGAGVILARLPHGHWTPRGGDPTEGRPCYVEPAEERSCWPEPWLVVDAETGWRYRSDDPERTRVTDCCGGWSTYMEDILCCKTCYEPVGVGQGDGSDHAALDADVHPNGNSAQWSVPAWRIGLAATAAGCVWICDNELSGDAQRYVVCRVWPAADDDGDPTYPGLPEAYFSAVDGNEGDAHVTDAVFKTWAEALVFARVLVVFAVAQDAAEDEEALEEANAAYALATGLGWHYEDDEPFMDWALHATQPEILAHAITCLARALGSEEVTVTDEPVQP